MLPRSRRGAGGGVVPARGDAAAAAGQREGNGAGDGPGCTPRPSPASQQGHIANGGA